MNSVQLHLALTHVPVILSLMGLVMLIVSLLMKNTMLTKTSYILLFFAGVAALPVYFSGEGAEEAVERLPGVSETVIEEHEEIAKLAMISIVTAGLLALAAFFSIKWIKVYSVTRIVVLIVALASGGLMLQTAHLGGQIRHTEIRNGFAQQPGNENENEQKDKGEQEKEND